MAKPSTEQLKQTLQELVTKHNDALKVLNECKQRIIAVQAVINDREDGDTDISSSEYSED